MPTSVLLAVLAAAGLLALAPALVRRYDATERLAAERAQSTARVLERRRRSRTVPGRRPVRPPIAVDASAAGSDSDDPPVRVADDRAVGRAVWLSTGRGVRDSTVAAAGQRSGGGRVDRTRDGAADPSRSREAAARRAAARRRAKRPPQSPAIYRRRRVLAGLVALNIIELIGVGTVSSGFWTGFGVTAFLLVGYVVHLRNEAMADARQRRADARHAAAVASVQAEIRAEQAKRLAARKDALRRAAAARAAAQREAVRLSQRYVDFDPARRARVRGRAYDTTGFDGRASGQ